ncbi:hypothetical protein [Streptomyces sp. NPDC001020]
MNRVTVAMAFVRMARAESTQCRGRLGEEPALAYFRCMASAYGSVRRWNPDAGLVLVTTRPLPEPYAGQLARIGVETVLAPFAHRPPKGLGKGWVSSLYHLDAMEALRGRGGTQVFIEPDLLCVRPLDDMLATLGDRVGAQFEPELMRPETKGWGWYWDLCDEMHVELGEKTGRHQPYSGSFYVVPEQHGPVLLERIERAWQLSLERHRRGRLGFSTDEQFMNYALRGVPVAEMSSHTRVIPTTPWRRYLTDRETIRGLTLWNLTHEKDLGFQRMYGAAVDPRSWFWTAPEGEFRERAGALMSALGPVTPQRAILNAVGGAVEKLTTDRMRHRLKPLYARTVQLYSSLRFTS